MLGKALRFRLSRDVCSFRTRGLRILATRYLVVFGKSVKMLCFYNQSCSSPAPWVSASVEESIAVTKQTRESDVNTPNTNDATFVASNRNMLIFGFPAFLTGGPCYGLAADVMA